MRLRPVNCEEAPLKINRWARSSPKGFRIAYRGMAGLADQLGIQCDARVYRAADEWHDGQLRSWALSALG